MESIPVRAQDAFQRIALLSPGSWVLLADPADAPDDRTRQAIELASRHELLVSIEPQHCWAEHLPALRDLGVRALRLHAGRPWKEMLAGVVMLDHLRATIQVPLELVDDDLIELAVDAQAPIHLVGQGDAGQVDRAWRRVAGRVELRTELDLPWTTRDLRPGPEPADVADANLVHLLRAGVRLASVRNGVRRTRPDAISLVGTKERLCRLLAAVGWPVHSAPEAWGGLRSDTTPAPPPCRPLKDSPNIHVMVPPIRDAILAHSTLPALAEALRVRATVRVHSAWAAPFNPFPLPAGLPDDDTEAREWANSHVREWVRSLDLSDADAVIAPGWLWGEVALRHKSLPDRARVIVTDLHLLEGIERWKRRWLGQGTRSLGTNWWPSERVHVHSCFPGLARLHWYASVPLRQIHWRPYPTALEPGPDPREARWVFTGGAHLRDYDTLAAACPAEGLPVRMFAPRPPRKRPDRIEFHGPAPLRSFYEAIQRSRYVVIPVHHHQDRAAGISVLAMARAAGRPVIVTATPGTASHVIHGHDGLLVPPGDPVALYDAMKALDSDDRLLSTLARGSEAHAAVQHVSAWADAILDGAPLPRPVAHPATQKSPWTAWATR